MNPIRTLSIWCLLLTGNAQALAVAPQVTHYNLQVRLAPTAHRIEVTAEVLLPPFLAIAGAEFVLNENMVIATSKPALEATGGSDGHRKSYRLIEAPVDGQVQLTYSGAFDYGLSDQKEEYTRGFRETVGILGDEGVYLSGASAWTPSFSDDLITFDLDIESVPGWHVISQGNGQSGDGDGKAHWSSGGELEQVYLVGGKLNRWSQGAGSIEALVYLHADEEPLATKYLETTARYIEMYRSLIGPYPYEKFALVENFWETGYGMPSFTLLGEQIVRFPFILHSSYPHEILHNWWGNSVFVDYDSGNWCEGLTAYMADHLVQEQRGAGAIYRRGTLQKYRDYVKEGRDFPLEEFTSRHDGATEAVGYGKSLMGFHMLRRTLGDEFFRAGLADFYRSNRGRRASFDDIRLSMEGRMELERQEFFGEPSLTAFFAQWLKRSGAPKLELSSLDSFPVAGGFEIKLEISQVQKAPVFQLRLPIAIQTEAGVETFDMRMDR
ncbi:MAG: aminopeptidase N, partial [Candidatus Paceibacteria bacterium]